MIIFIINEIVFTSSGMKNDSIMIIYYFLQWSGYHNIIKETESELSTWNNFNNSFSFIFGRYKNASFHQQKYIAYIHDFIDKRIFIETFLFQLMFQQWSKTLFNHDDWKIIFLKSFMFLSNWCIFWNILPTSHIWWVTICCWMSFA